jgi:hypothetical protein
MTNQEILTKAIQKAIDGGWDCVIKTDAHGRKIKCNVPGTWCHNWPSTIIFNKDFARALWGEGPCCLTCGCTEVSKSKRKGWSDTCEGCIEPQFSVLWKWHLRQLVIADDVLAYLGENI